MFENEDLPSLEFVEGSAKDIRGLILTTLGHGDYPVTVRLRSGREFTGTIHDTRIRHGRKELQVKLVNNEPGQRFSLILRIPYDDDSDVTAEVYDFRPRGLTPNE